MPRFYLNTPSENAKSYVSIYCDGSVIDNGTDHAFGGAGAYCMVSTKYGSSISRVTKLKKSLKQTTNNQAELYGAIIGLEWVTKNIDTVIYVHSDSSYLIKGATGVIAVNTNLDLWSKLEAITKSLRVCWIWVRGHAGNFCNEQAHELAEKARLRAMERWGK